MATFSFNMRFVIIFLMLISLPSLHSSRLEDIQKLALIAFDGQQIVRACVNNLLGNALLTAHGVDRDQGSLDMQNPEQLRDCSDLVGFLVDPILSQDQ